MATSVQDIFMLFGDSITEGGWEHGLNAFGQRLSRMCYTLVVISKASMMGDKQMFMLGSWMS